MRQETVPRGDVEVLHEGQWLPGPLLHAYRCDDGRWRGIVRYTACVGERSAIGTASRPTCQPRRRPVAGGWGGWVDNAFVTYAVSTLAWP